MKKSQSDFESDKDFSIIRDMKVFKRRKETLEKHGVPLRDVPLPLKGDLSRLTNLVTDYLHRIGDTEMLFPSNKKHENI
jgi:hypothetical protein